MNLGENEKRGYLRDPYVRFFLILAAGLALRIFLSQFLTYGGDFNAWKGWGQQLTAAGFGKFYGKYWCDYMPGYLYVLWLLDNVHRAVPAVPVDILFKLPANIADLGISVVIFFSLRLITTSRNAMIASVVYFFNPASLSNSTFWGQVDSFHALPMLLSVYFGLRRKYMLLGLFAALAFMIKPQSLVIFPLLGFIGLKPVFESRKLTVRSILPSVELVSAALVTAVMVTLPFIWDEVDSVFYLISGPFNLIMERFNAAYGQYTFSSLNAFNFWGVTAMWVPDDKQLLGVTYRNIGTLIFGAIYALIAGLLIRFTIRLRTTDLSDYGYYVFEAITLVLFTLYLFVTRAHERHLLPTIVFCTLLTFRSWVYWYIYAVVSCVYVANMVYSYIQLTTEYRGVPAEFSDYFVPGMFSLYLIGYIIILFGFVVSISKHENSIGNPVPRIP